MQPWEGNLKDKGYEVGGGAERPPYEDGGILAVT